MAKLYKMEIPHNSMDIRRFQLTHAWVIVGLFIATTIAVSFPVAMVSLIAKGLAIDSPQLNAWMTVVSTVLCYAILFFIINQIFGKSTISKPLFEDKQIDWVVYILILLAIVSLAIVLEPLSTLLLKLLPMPTFFEDIFNKAFTPTVSTFIMVVVIAPFGEEILMRGVILRGLLTSMSPTKAIVWSSLLFAIIHLNPWQALPAFIIGLFLGWMYYKTRSIWPSIFIHLVNNLLAFIGITIADSKGLGIDTTLQDLTGGYFSSIFTVAVVLLIFSFGLLHKRYRLKKGNIP